jgi:hypothetical protein
MAYPGSGFFNGDSLKYLQVITAHALIMIFFVVVPIFFGGFANFLLPYHIGSKDVAFPRLNSLGFWIQPCGFLLIAKIGFVRTEYWRTQDKVVNYLQAAESNQYSSLYANFIDESYLQFKLLNTTSTPYFKMEHLKRNIPLTNELPMVKDVMVKYEDPLVFNTSVSVTFKPLVIDSLRGFQNPYLELQQSISSIVNTAFHYKLHF